MMLPSHPEVVLALLLDLIVLLVVVFVPLHHRYPDDLGDGRSVVLVPAPYPLSVWRTVRAIVTFLVIGALLRATWGSWSLDRRYADLVSSIASRAVEAPAQIHSLEWSVPLGLRGLIVAVIISFAVGVRANPVRRLMMLVHVPIFLGLTIVVDSLMLVLDVMWPPLSSLDALVGQFVTLSIGLVVLLRLVFATFALPRATDVPAAPGLVRRSGGDAVLLVIVTLVGIILAGCLSLYLIQAVPQTSRATLLAVLPLPFAGLSTLIRTVLLHFMRWARPADPPLPADPPPVSVIIPAYNEQEQIVDTLTAIDRAAGVHGGPVHVIVANDASKDDTERLARETIAAFRHATGEVLTARRGGKSASLNAALAATTTDIVIRIDADTHIHENSIRYATRWFVKPEIGLVEAMVIPKEGGSWLRRMRVFETLRIHGFMHPAYQMVDAVNVVPGMFTAFRRAAVLEIGGFTAGMNGEDADLTLQMGRLGYRTWLDPEVIMYEDVPNTITDFREQRSRWSRATVMAFARHSPFRLGPGTPQVWFSQTRLMLFRLVSVARVAAWIYLPILALFAGTSRAVIVGFIFGWVVFCSLLAVVDLFYAIRFRVVARTGWFVTIIPFIVLRQLYSLEGLLSLPTRPVRLPGAALEGRSTEPVIH